jgi:hypothetical protein
MRVAQLLEQSLDLERRLGQLSAITLSTGCLRVAPGDRSARGSLSVRHAQQPVSGELRPPTRRWAVWRLAAAVRQFEVAGRLYGATESRERASLDITEETRAVLHQVPAQVRSAVGVEAFNAIAAGGRAVR